jgi:RNA polymerase sigma-70 factor (ECF subfamily)
MGAQPAWYEGRDAIVAGWEPILHGPDAREFRFVATSANRQPAAGSYVRVPGETEYEAFALVVLRIQDAAVAEVNVFDASLFPLFGLPQAL